MKIAIFGRSFNQPQPTGGERRRIELARRLEERGYDVTLYGTIPKIGDPWRGTKFPSKVKPYPNRAVVADFIFAADLVTAPYFDKAQGRKVWMIQYYYPETEQYLERPEIIKVSFNSWHADWFKRKFNQEAIRAIGGVNTTFFNPPGPTIRHNQARREKLIIAQNGNHWWHKGYRLVELAFKDLNQDGFKLEPLKGKDQYELRDKYRKAMFFVTAENYPVFCWNNPAAEAMACGCPVIVVDHPATKDHCIHQKTAEVVPTRVPSISQALEGAMQKLIQDEEYRKSLAEKAWRYIHNFDYDKVVDVIEDEILKASPEKVKVASTIKLNLGCGHKKKEGYINIDNRKEVEPDMVVDFEKGKLPFDMSTVDEIYISHLLEHIHNFIPFMEEMYRVLKPHGKVAIKAPYGLSEGGIGDPTHAGGTPLAPRTFNYFDRSNQLWSLYNFKTDFKVIKAERTGDDIFGIISLYVELEAVKNPAATQIIKKTQVAFFPSNNINAGGSRHSCYQVARGLRKQGYDTAFETNHSTDIAVFEKRFGPQLAASLKANGAKIVFVCCDPLWLTGLEVHITKMLEIADCAVVSSKKLAKWYKQKGIRVEIIREGFDWDGVPKVEKEPNLTLCWHGTSYTINHGCLESLIQPLRRLKKDFDFNLKLIVDQPGGGLKMPNFGFEPQVVEWELESFLPEIAKCHIGLGPELNDEWCSYKSFGKPTSYMGLGLVPVMSPVPSYEEIIVNGKNGFIIKNNDPDEWYEVLKGLIGDKEKRLSLAREGKKLAREFTLEKIAKSWHELITAL